MNSFSLLIPFVYFAKTRLRSWRSFLFHSHLEWIPSLLILHLLANHSLTESILLFFKGYLCFISFYEIGYFINDYVATRNESNPRSRLASYTIHHFFIFFFIVIRLSIVSLLAFAFWADYPLFWQFYLFLAILLFFHNTITHPEFKIGTFIGLAFFRFYAPFILFIDGTLASALVPSVFIGYILLRTLTYLDSKGLLRLTARKKPSFRLYFYLLVLPVSAIVATFQNNLLPLLSNVYFSLPWLVFTLIPTPAEAFDH